MKFKIGISGDLINSDGLPCFGEGSLEKIYNRKDLQMEWMNPSIAELSQDLTAKYDAILLNLPKANGESVKRNDCRLKIISRFGVGFDSVDIKAMKDKPIKIGIIKSLEPYNGIEYLIDAFNILMKKKILDVELKILGEGSNAKKLKNYVNNLGLNDYVIFEGQIKHTDIVPYYNELSIFACPSLRESFGVSVLEASACGLPVIANNIGGLKDIVVHGKTGYLIDTLNIKEFAFYLEKLILDNDLRKKMGKNGRNFTKEKYEWSNCVDSLISNY